VRRVLLLPGSGFQLVGGQADWTAPVTCAGRASGVDLDGVFDARNQTGKRVVRRRVLPDHRHRSWCVRGQAIVINDRAKDRVDFGHQLAELRTVADNQALWLSGDADGLTFAFLGREPA